MLNRYWASHPAPDPIDIKNSGLRRAMAAATGSGTSSISAPNAPAASRARACRHTRRALSAVLPTALNPLVQVAWVGMKPMWPITGSPSAARRATVSRPAAQ